MTPALGDSADRALRHSVERRVITVNRRPTDAINHEVLHAMKYYTSTTEYNCGIDPHARQM